jgi:hypothetical protein
MVHEYGHLVGRAHEERAGDLMSAVYTTPLAECQPAAARRAKAAQRARLARR